MSLAKSDRHWSSLFSSALAAVVVGFTSTILLVIEGIRAVGGTPEQQASSAASICYAMAITSFVLGVYYRKPLITAWSTPGAVLLATSVGVGYPEAIGAFIAAGVLMVLTALIKPVARAIAQMPAAIAAAMLAGVLFRYVGGVPASALAMPAIVVPLIFCFFALRAILPMYAVPVVVGLGVAFAALNGSIVLPSSIEITPLIFEMPKFDLQAMIGLGVPLYLVTMASQNLPGFAVQRSFGYQPPVAGCLTVTGLGSILFAPFGTHAVNMAAIVAALCSGPETHPDPGQRWKALIPYALLYLVVGLAAGTFISVLGHLPKELITAIAGLGLFAPMMNGMAAMVKEPSDIEAAVVTFIVTASGISLFSVGAAFWGLAAGLMIWGSKKLLTV